MRITARTSFAGRDFSAVNGQVLDLPEVTARDLIQAGYAEEAKDEDKRDNAGAGAKPAKGKRGGSK